jgi:tRNA pseudouridine55 synthase
MDRAAPSATPSAAEAGARDGVLLVDKPAGMTSHEVVARVRRERGGKVGHAGTLDPFATGLLIVLLGRATRLQRYLLPLAKVYRATARLGWRSSTGDPDGELVETGIVPAALELPTGRIRQRLPMTSAVKVGGERLYRRAHRGERFETPEREVQVQRAQLLGTDGARAEFEIECSSGTYVRTLVETLEDAYCERLRRTAVGPFRVEGASPRTLDPNEALKFMPARELDAHETERVSHGVALAPADAPQGAAIRLVHGGRLIAVARGHDDALRPEVVLA